MIPKNVSTVGTEIGKETMKQLDHCFVSKQDLEKLGSCFTVSKQSLEYDGCCVSKQETGK